MRAALFLVALLVAPTLALGADADANDVAAEPTAVEKKVKAKKVAGLFLGNWAVQLTDGQQRQLDAMVLALQPNTSDADIDALDLSIDERASVDALRAIAQLDPERAEGIREEQRKMFDAFTKLTITVTEGGMTTELPGGETVTATYTVQSSQDNTLNLSVTADDETRDMVVRFMHKDLVQFLGEGPEPMHLKRVE